MRWPRSLRLRATARKRAAPCGLLAGGVLFSRGVGVAGCFGLGFGSGRRQRDSEFFPLAEDVFLAEKALMAEALLAFGVVEDLRWDELELVRLGRSGVLPDIDKL